jgi:hypothetical protein
MFGTKIRKRRKTLHKKMFRFNHCSETAKHALRFGRDGVKLRGDWIACPACVLTKEALLQG